mmetsp:Transcript_53327/g.122549  ORF Transcript_53327/g.122549 Transcript_53327/m.122549 type:complete len:608 (-) Transcript_53327:503-2326(-)
MSFEAEQRQWREWSSWQSSRSTDSVEEAKKVADLVRRRMLRQKLENAIDSARMAVDLRTAKVSIEVVRPVGVTSQSTSLCRAFSSCLRGDPASAGRSFSWKWSSARQFVLRHALEEKLSKAVSLALFAERPESVMVAVLNQFETDREVDSVTRLQAMIRGSKARRELKQTRSNLGKTHIVIIMDPGQDLDDEMTLVLLRALWDRELVQPHGIVATLAPSHMRAQLAHGTLAKLGLNEVPVAAGSDGGSSGTVSHLEELDYLRYASVVSMDSGAFMTEVLESVAEKSLTFVVIASMRDIANQLMSNEALFKSKVKEVVLMGGVKRIRPGCLLEPDTAANNQFDMKSAEFFYRRCQEVGVPLLVVSRFAAYSCQLPRAIYDDMAATGSHVGKHLRAVQAHTIEQLWRRANAAEGSELRAGLPLRCDKAWFLATFCGGRGDERSGADSIWDLIQGFNMYDPLALVAALPKLGYFFNFRRHEINGVTHRVIGTSKEDTGVCDAEVLRKYLYQSFMEGIQGELLKERLRKDHVERMRKQLQYAIQAIDSLEQTNRELTAKLEEMKDLNAAPSKERPEQEGSGLFHDIKRFSSRAWQYVSPDASPRSTSPRLL